MHIDDLNKVFTAWADVGRPMPIERSTDDSWTNLYQSFSSLGQRRLRFIESAAYAAMHDCILEDQRRHVAKYIVMLGVLSDVGQNRPNWIQNQPVKGKRGQLLGLRQREAVYQGLASSFESLSAPENIRQAHHRLTCALRRLACVDRKTASHLMIYDSIERYSSGKREMQAAFQDIETALDEIQNKLQSLFKIALSPLFEMVFVKTVFTRC